MWSLERSSMIVHRVRTAFFLLLLGYVSGLGAVTTTWSNSSTVTTSIVLSGSDTLVLTKDHTITVSGDVQVRVTGDATMDVGATAGTGSVTMKPADNCNAHLSFSVVEGKTLTVRMWNDLFFTGNDTGSKPMYLSFTGKGTVKFRLPSGKTLSFGGAATVGTLVRVLMAQEPADTAIAQVIFEKWSYDADSVNTDLTLHSWVKIGRNSSFLYVSHHKEGLPALDKPYGYGTVAFDPTNKGTGRLVLDIAAGASAGDFKDGAFNVCGARIIGSGAFGQYDIELSDYRTGVYPRDRAGLQAIFRVSDSVALNHFKTNDAANYPSNWTAHKADTTNRRGLVIINRNHSLPRFANNYDQVTTLTSSVWYQANTYQTGFVLGNNGMLEVEHNRFIDYIAGAKNTAITGGTHTQSGATATSNDTHHASKVKKHNPAALIIDGFSFTYASATTFTYNGNDIAQIKFKGNGGLFVRVGASSDTGALLNETMNASGVATTGTGDVYIAGVIGKGSYDGVSVPVLVSGTTTVTTDQSAEPEGEHAIDIEGSVKIFSVEGDGGEAKAGFINIPTIMLDHAGRELKFANSTTVRLAGNRPLSMATTDEYYRYNTSSILVNATIEAHDVTLIHNDVSRDLSCLPDSSANASPAIVGGELTSLSIASSLKADPNAIILDYTGAAIYLYNSTIACHESLVSAGVRWAVREVPIEIANSETWTYGDNTSKLIFYNRGNSYDLDISGYGRVFQLGSRANVMADGTTYQPFSINGVKPSSSLRDAFIDVFRQEPSPDTNITGSQNVIKLSLQTAEESGVASDERAIHVVYLGNKSQINLGWAVGQHDSSGTVKVLVDKNYYPAEYDDTLLATELTQSSSTTNLFSPYSEGVGELELAGHNLYFGAGGRHDVYGDLNPANNELAPRSVSDVGGIIYVDYGGKLSTSGTYDMLLNTVIARRVSKVAVASGSVTLTSDQIILQDNGKIQNYGFDVTNDPQPYAMNSSIIPSMLIHVPDIPSPDGFVPIKGVSSWDEPGGLTRGSGFWGTRATVSVTAPVTMPASGMLVMTTGDNLEQAQVSGSTRANPLHLYISGNTTGFARVREFVSVASDPVVLGEGDHAALFLDGGARIGLGSRHWNEKSLNAWNHLGADKVSLFLNGNSVVDVNSDLLVIDKLPFVATTNFGATVGKTHRITFYSEVPREIRVPANGELDLSSFGQGGQGYRQQIAFGGQVRLVLEPGAKIRFPDLDSTTAANRPILYFNDESELIFLGNDDRDEGRWTDGLAGSDKVRCKILGAGQIWLNKQARLKVTGSALVGIEADKDTPKTDVVISMARQSAMYIGDENKAGGAFQIGNIVDNGGDGTSTTTTEISFTLTVDGPKAKFHMDREAFFGIGVGVVNKADNPNGETGNEANTAWRVQSLHNLKNITLNITKGTFEHGQIFDGDDSQSSVFAVGPLDTRLSGKYTLTMGIPGESYIKGGGNLLYVDIGIPHTSPLVVAIKSTAAVLDGSDSGKYNLFAPSSLIRTYTSLTGATISSTASAYSFESSVVSDLTSQGTALVQFFSILRMPSYPAYTEKYVAAGKDQFTVRAGYVNGTAIQRQIVALARNKFGASVDPIEALEKGYFSGASVTSDGGPASFIVP